MRAAAALCVAALLAMSGCATAPPPAPPAPPPVTRPDAPPPPGTVATAVPPGLAGAIRPASWRSLPGWTEDDPSRAWDALRESCRVLGRQDAWREACLAAEALAAPDRASARRFFETWFQPWGLVRPDGRDTGLITGYYEPLLRGSRQRTDRYRHAVYAPPDDLLVIELDSLHPELKGLRLRGRLEGRRVVPYPDRARIEQGLPALEGKEIVWVDDEIDLFFLHVQGSGRILLEDGSTVRVGFADQNGHPYRSIGRWLVERGELPLEKASMQGIRAWARDHPERVRELLDHNGRYVFFRELPPAPGGPPGSLGVPLTARRSVAVDPRYIPLGAPLFIDTTWPLSDRPLRRLVLAQDTGSAIKGPVRADFFWGHGPGAAYEAGRMKQPLRAWLLLPRGFPLNVGP